MEQYPEHSDTAIKTHDKDTMKGCDRTAVQHSGKPAHGVAYMKMHHVKLEVRVSKPTVT